MHVKRIVSILLLSIVFPAFAWAAPAYFTYQGQIIKPNGQALEANNVYFQIEILSPEPELCVLYEESHTLNMMNSNGIFAVTVGEGTRPGDGSFQDVNTLTNALNNFTGTVSPNDCVAGPTYTPDPSDGRKLRITFDDGSGPVTLAQDHNVVSVPYAANAASVSGITASELLTINNGTGFNLTQSNLDFVFNDTNWTELQALLDGTSTSFSAGAPTADVDNNNQKIINLNDPNPGTDTDAVNVRHARSYIGGRAVDTTNLGSLAGGADVGKVISWDGTQWITSVIDDTTKLPTAGGTMSGPINMGNQNITNANDISAGNNLSVGQNASVGNNLTVSGGIGVTNGLTSGGHLQVNNEMELRLLENSVNGTEYVSIKSPANLGANVNLTLPSNDGDPGQYLQTDGSGVLSWQDVNAGVTQVFGRSGNVVATAGDYDADLITFDNTYGGDVDSATNVQAGIEELSSEKLAKAGDSMTGNLVMDLNTGVTTELRFQDTGTKYIGFKAPNTVTAPSSFVWTLPVADGTAGQVLSTSGAGVLSWVDKEPVDYVSDSRVLTAGAGLTGGGDLSSDRSFDIGAGNGITVNANDIEVRAGSGISVDGSGVNVDIAGTADEAIVQGTDSLLIRDSSDAGNLKEMTRANFVLSQSEVGAFATSEGFLQNITGTELDNVWSGNGILVRTAPGTYSAITDNSSDWDQAFAWGDHSATGYLTSESQSLDDAYNNGSNIDVDVTDVIFNLSATNDFQIQDNGIASFIVTDSGDVGIGTATPGQRFHVEGGDFQFGGTADSERALSFFRNSAQVGKLSTGNSSFTIAAANNRDIVIQDDTSTRLIVKDGGNIGIGTSSPNSKFHVEGDLTVTDGGMHFLNQLELSVNPSVAGTATEYIGRRTRVSGPGANSLVGGSINGSSTEIEHSGAGDVSSLSGAIIELKNTGTGDSGANFGTLSAINNESTGTIGFSYNFYAINSNTGGGTIGQAAGLYIADLSGDETYGIFQSHTSDKNYFAGNVGLGTTSPQSRLHVDGGVQIGDDLDACSATKQGTLKYVGGTVSFCDGSSWEAFGTASGGEVNTATSVGGATPIFKQKSGVNFEFRTLASANSKIGVSTVADVVTLTVDESQFDATAIPIGTTPLTATTLQAAIVELNSAKVASATQIISGDGLTGGGDLSTDRTLAVGAGNGINVNANDVEVVGGSAITVDGTGVNVDITNETNETSVANGDEILIHDVSAGGLRKMTRSNFVLSSAEVEAIIADDGYILNGGNATGAPLSVGTTDSQDLNFITNNTPAMTLSAGGNLGIGTTSASAQLTLEKSFSSGSGPDNGFLSTVTNSAGTTGGQLHGHSINTLSTGGTRLEMDGVQINTNAFAGAITNDLTGLYVGVQGGATISGDSYGLIIENFATASGDEYGLYQTNPSNLNHFAGNVGIGTAVPERLLHVDGPIRVNPQALPASPQAGDIAFDSGDSNKLKFYNGSSWVEAGGSGGSSLWTDNAGDISYVSGNVGVGTTSPSSLLDIASSLPTLTLTDTDLTRRFTITHDSATSSISNSTGTTAAINISPRGGGGSVHNVGIFRESNTSGNADFMIYRANGTDDVNHLLGKGDSYLAAYGGNVGIGTSSPTVTLDVDTGTINAAEICDENNANCLDLSAGVSGGGDPSYGSSASSPVDAVYVNNSGLIGVGTTAPSSQFQVSGGTGTLSTGLTFGDGDTGFFEPSDDALNVAFGGTARIFLRTNGISSNVDHGYMVSSNNTVTFAPSDGDQNSGLGWLSNDNIAMFTGGSNRMTWDASGNVGIGTTAPQALLDVAGTGALLIPRGLTGERPGVPENGMIRYNSTNNKVEVYENSSWQNVATGSSGTGDLNNGGNTGAVTVGSNDSTLVLESNNTPALSFDTSQNATLSGAMTIQMNGDNDMIILDDTNGTADDVSIRNNGMNFYMDHVQSPKDLFGFNLSTGNVKIGTAVAGTANLTVHERSANGSEIRFTNTDSGETSADGTRLGIDDDEHAYINQEENLDFWIGTNNIERFRILASGNVGIGTSNPAVALDVANGTINAGEICDENNANCLDLSAGVSGGDPSYGSSGSSPADSVYVDNSGFVGIGTTSPAGNLHLWGSGTLGSNGNLYFGDRGENSNPYIGERGSGDSDQLEIVGKLGIYFRTGSGSGTENMVLDQAGNLGVGTTSPERALHVDGLVRVTPQALPASPQAGDLAFDNTDSNKLKYYDGSSWVDPASGGGGEANTASNVGAGQAIFKQKNLENFEFKTLTAASSRVSLSSGANEVSVDVSEGNINHDNLSGFVAGEHVNHGLVTLTAGAGLTGGGDITSSRSFAVGAGPGINVNANDVEVDISGTTATTVREGTDSLLIHDNSAGALRRITTSNFLSGYLQASIGTSAGDVMGADSVPHCDPDQKLEMSVGPSYFWSCVSASGSASSLDAPDGAPTQVLSIDNDGEIVLGTGDGAIPSTTRLRGASAAGLDVPGGDLYIDASNGTGGGGSGDIIFRTAEPSAAPIGVDYANISTSVTNSSSMSTSHTIPTKANGLLMVGVTIDSNDTVTSLTYNGVSLTLLDAQSNSSATRAEVWYLLNPPSGTNTLSLTLSGNDQVLMGAIYFYNVDQGTPFGTHAKSSGTADPIVGSVSSATDEYVFDVLASDSVANMTADGSQTELWDSSMSGLGQGAASLRAGDSTANVSWTLDGPETYAHIIVPIKPQNPGGTALPGDSNLLGERLRIDKDGNVGIGTDAPDEILTVYNGSTYGRYTTGGWTHSSDRRLKEDIRHVDSSLEKILQLKPVTYRYRTDREEKQQIGFIAQDVEPLFPEVVETDDEGLKSMIYSNLIAPVVKAIQELNSKIDKLFATQEKEAKEVDRLKRDLARQRIEHEQKVKKLESQNEQLEKRLEAIEKLIQEKTQQ